jgi:dTDP-4-amino-4,6-dideoxygalactose transaminase
MGRRAFHSGTTLAGTRLAFKFPSADDVWLQDWSGNREVSSSSTVRLQRHRAQKIVHIRINIPSWNWNEIARGTMAIASGGRSDFRRRLLLELQREAPGRTPRLVSSARYAISLAARKLGLEGRRVAVPGYVCPAVLTGLRAARVEPVAIDCLPDSIRFDSDALARAIAKEGIAGILAANTYGFDQDFSMLSELGVPVIEDAAYQSGRTEAGSSRLCGMRGDAGVWSFNFKALTSVGGGVLFVRDETSMTNGEVASSSIRDAMLFFNYAARSIGRHHIPTAFPGAEAPRPDADMTVRSVLLDLRDAPMSELQAAVALVQWESRDRLAAIQVRNSTLLADVIARCESLSTLSGHETAVHLFPVLVRVGLGGESAAALAVQRARAHLHSQGIQTETPYPMVWKSPINLPNSRDLAARMFLVPCNASLGDVEMKKIAVALAEASEIVTREFKIEARG